MSKFFIAGTDTDAGKTLVSAALLHKANLLGAKTMGLKPIAAGADSLLEGKARNSDAVLLQQTASIELAYDSVNPVLLEQAIAPHIAAELAGRNLSAQRLAGFCRGAMMQKSDLCLVEGAGGWLVPLNQRETMADLAKQLALPVVLVVGMRLGCINHALLSQAAIELSGLPLAGWVATQIDGEQPYAQENLASLEARLRAPCLGYIPNLADPSPEAAAEFLDISKLINIEALKS